MSALPDDSGLSYSHVGREGACWSRRFKMWHDRCYVCTVGPSRLAGGPCLVCRKAMEFEFSGAFALSIFAVFFVTS